MHAAHAATQSITRGALLRLTVAIIAITCSSATAQEATVFSTTEPHDLFSGRVLPASAKADQFSDETSLVIPPVDAGKVSIPDFHSSPPVATPLAIPQPSDEDGDIHVFRSPDEPKDSEKRLSMRRLMHEPYTAYRSEQSKFAWLPGTGQDFGWLDWQEDPYLDRGDTAGLTGAINFHWLAGPTSSPLPPRVYDFSLGFQVRNKFSDHLSYDLHTSIGVYSDFEDSARDGVRFPGHAVGMFHMNSSTDVIFGVDYPDRDDFAILPVAGISLRDVFVPGLRMDLVFPRPRIDYMLSDSRRVYLAALLGGGTWDIEFPDEANHVMTYRDYRLMLGFEYAEKDGGLSSWEFGYVFSRSLEFRGIPGNTHFDDAFLIQWVTRR